MHGASRRLGSATYVAILLCTELSYSVCAIEAAEFDLPLVIACRDVTPDEFASAHPDQRVIGASIRVSVRFHGDDAREIEQLNIDVLGTSNAQRVYRFAPTTQLISDLGDTIEHTITTEKSGSLNGSLGGQLPVFAGDLVAHVTPSVSGGVGRRTAATETTRRLTPKHAVVVSGTTDQSRGVFFKLRRSSQTTLEGTHDLNVQFIVPADWQSGRIEVSCAAHGTHKLFGLVEQPKLSGQLRRTVELHLAGNTEARQAAERRARRDKTTVRRPIACECDCPAGQGV